jgi:hypothetical protein
MEMITRRKHSSGNCATIINTVFWDVKPCSLVEFCRRFIKTSVYCDQATRRHIPEDTTLRSHCGENLIFSINWAFIEKLPIVQLLKNFPTFSGTRWFINVFLHWSLYWSKLIESIQSIPSLRSILILSTHLRPSFLVVSFLLASPPIPYMHSSSPPPFRATLYNTPWL